MKKFENYLVMFFDFHMSPKLASPTFQYLSIMVIAQTACMKVTYFLEEFQGSASWAMGKYKNCCVKVIDIQKVSILMFFR